MIKRQISNKNWPMGRYTSYWTNVCSLQWYVRTNKYNVLGLNLSLLIILLTRVRIS